VIRILVVQPAPLLRCTLAAALHQEGDLEVVAQVSDLPAAAHAAGTTHPDVAVLDVDDADPVVAAKEVCAARPGTRALVVVEATRHDVLARVGSAVLGTVGFITRSASLNHLVSAVRSLARGCPVIDPALVASHLTEPENPLTPREHQVLSLAAEGTATAEIAKRLRLSAGTVRNCLSRIYGKAGAGNRVEAIHHARRAGWL